MIDIEAGGRSGSSRFGETGVWRLISVVALIGAGAGCVGEQEASEVSAMSPPPTAEFAAGPSQMNT